MKKSTDNFSTQTVYFFSWEHPNRPNVYFSSGWETLKSDTFQHKFPKFSRRASRADKKSSFVIAFLDVSADFIFSFFIFIFSPKNGKILKKKLKGLQNLPTDARELESVESRKKNYIEDHLDIRGEEGNTHENFLAFCLQKNAHHLASPLKLWCPICKTDSI